MIIFSKFHVVFYTHCQSWLIMTGDHWQNTIQLGRHRWTQPRGWSTSTGWKKLTKKIDQKVGRSSYWKQDSFFIWPKVDGRALGYSPKCWNHKHFILPFLLSIKSEDASEWHKNNCFVDSYSLSSIKIEKMPFLPDFQTFNLYIRGNFCLVTWLHVNSMHMACPFNELH